jgi:CDP-diacylglycerol--glycerol-3-phosphate 3-phosphatidyltransferase
MSAPPTADVAARIPWTPWRVLGIALGLLVLAASALLSISAINEMMRPVNADMKLALIQLATFFKYVQGIFGLALGLPGIAAGIFFIGATIDGRIFRKTPRFRFRMATIYELKPKFQNLLRPVCGRLARAGVTANQVTVLALLLSISEGIWIATTQGSMASLLALPVVLFLRMALNAIDGMLAREWNQKTRLGAVLNEAGDIISDIALYLPFALILAGIDSSLIVLIVVLAVFTELAGIASQIIGYGGRRYDGPFGKSDRAAFFGVLAVLLALGITPGMWTTIVLAASAVLCLVTVINRVLRGIVRRPAA